LTYCLTVPITAEAADDIARSIREASLDANRAVAVRAVEIDMGRATLHLEEGLLVPATPIRDRTLELVFEGSARFSITPPNEIEAQQLQLFTDQSHLDVAVLEAVLLVGDPALVRRLLDRPRGEIDPTRLERAKTTFAGWVQGAERSGLGDDGAMYAAASGDELTQGRFTVWCRSESLGDFYYVVDPFSREQVSLGQFVAAEIDETERYRIEKWARKQQRHGRLSQFRATDLGDWDTWLSTSLADEAGKVAPGGSRIEPSRYALDVEILPSNAEIRAKARIDLTPTTAGRRVLTFELFEDLAVTRARDSEGRDLAWFRTGDTLQVALLTSTTPGTPLTVEIEYAGVLFDEIAPGVFRTRDTEEWYPRIGDIDRAKYEARLRWPKRYELFASGRMVEQGEEGGSRWQRRVLDVPSLGFSFEFGAFDVRTSQVGHVAITVAFSKLPSAWGKDVKEQVIATIGGALTCFEKRFGAYPLDYLTLVTVPRQFSQGYLGFVTLAHSLVASPNDAWLMWFAGEDDPRSILADQRTETIAHELSHQWWGNRVGWGTYRDQWLSEALADFSATMFLAEQAERATVYLARHAVGWRSSLARATDDGREIGTLGPVVLGQRLSSSHSDQAYQAIVYDKGSVVMSMLARGLGRDPFLDMLRELAGAVDYRTLSTETFLRALEHMSGVDLKPFARQFVYGTTIPEVYYSYRVTRPPEGGWAVEGQAQVSSRALDRFALVRDASGIWNVERRRSRTVIPQGFTLVVPFQIAVRAGEDSGHGRDTNRVERGLGGALQLRGATSSFRIPLSAEPRHMWLDQRGEVLAHFYSRNHAPKRALVYEAMEQDAQEAEAMLKQALEAPLLSEAGLRDSNLSAKEQEHESRLLDAEIWLRLSTLYLDAGNDADARRALDEAMAKLPALDESRYLGWQTRIQSRLDVRAGDFKSAYNRLSKYFFLSFEQKFGESIRAGARRRKFEGGIVGDGGDYALLALAAHMTDHPEVAERAMLEARERGADTTALEELMRDTGAARAGA
jgi:hypothetical protein